MYKKSNYPEVIWFSRYVIHLISTIYRRMKIPFFSFGQSAIIAITSRIKKDQFSRERERVNLNNVKEKKRELYLTISQNLDLASERDHNFGILMEYSPFTTAGAYY